MIKKLLISFICFYSIVVYADQNFIFLGADITKELVLKQTHEKVVLQGYAANYQEGEPIYIGVFYTSDTINEPSVIFLKDLSMAMIFFFLQDDIPTEKMIRVFTEGLLINNPNWNQDPINRNRLLELQNVFQATLHAGDKVVFEYATNDELAVYVNDNLIKTWQNSRTFFNAILRIWLGSYPPSRAFKESILGI